MNETPPTDFWRTEDKYIFENGEVREEHDLRVWMQWFETADRTIAFTEINSQVYVSTVFLGMNWAPAAIRYKEPKREPVLFETMVFGGENDNYCRRYTTAKQALEGHKEIARRVWWDEPWWWTRLYRWLFPKRSKNAEGD